MQCQIVIDGVQCSRVARAKNECGPHRAQYLAGKPYKAIRMRQVHPSARDDLGRKWCCNCEEWKPPSEFPTGTNRSDGLYTYCKLCSIFKTKHNSFGVDMIRYDEMLAAQGGVCAICKQPESRGAWRLAIDHDHSCCPESGRSCGKCVRGLLCGNCNNALGNVRDSIDTLLSMVDYLQNWEETRA